METNKKLKQIKIENYIWIIYIIIIGLSYYSNKIEKEYIIYNDKNKKEKYRKLNILIFTTILLVYIYFTKESFNELYESNENTSKNKLIYDNLSLIATTLVLISGVIFLSIIIADEDLETEIAFT